MESRGLKVGQIWADQREEGQRLVEVTGFGERYVYLKTIQLHSKRWKRALGRHTRVLRRNFKPGAQGYSYVRDKEAL